MGTRHRELEILPAGTKPRTSHHRSPGGERRGKRKTFFTQYGSPAHAHLVYDAVLGNLPEIEF